MRARRGRQAGRRPGPASARPGGWPVTRLLASCLALAQIAAAGSFVKNPDGTYDAEILMPGVDIPYEDAYICTGVEWPADTVNIVHFAPKASQKTVHHMLFYGCTIPHRPAGHWNCNMEHICAGNSERQDFMYGWAKDAPELHLPDGVGFAVGPGTPYRYGVLQIHYNVVGSDDHSGITAKLTPQPQPNYGGTLMFASFFKIPPRAPAHEIIANVCYGGTLHLYGFAFRVHTHALGTDVRLDELARPDGSPPFVQEPYLGERNLMIRRDPQLPQMFQPIEGLIRLRPGISFSQVCTFDTSGVSKITFTGARRNQEMCNLYLMLYPQVPSPVYSEAVGPGTHVVYAGPAITPPHQAQGRRWLMTEEMPGFNGQLGRAQRAGVAAGPDGSLWVFHREDRAWLGDTFLPDHTIHHKYAAALSGDVVQRVDPSTGEVMYGFGCGEFVLPHMVTVDNDGNVWVVDVGLHQVMKFTPGGRRLLAVGTPRTPGKDRTTLCQPTSVAVASDGTFWVADGYCNRRVVKFSPEGRYLKEFERQTGTMAVPHKILLDECAGVIHVASRETSEVVAFDLEGNELRAWSLKHLGKVFSIAKAPSGDILALTWDNQRADAPPYVAQLLPRTVGELPSNSQYSWVTSSGLRPESSSLGHVWQPPGLVAPHEMAILPGPVGQGLHVYIAETRPPEDAEGSRLRKYLLLEEGAVRRPEPAHARDEEPPPPRASTCGRGAGGGGGDAEKALAGAGEGSAGGRGHRRGGSRRAGMHGGGGSSA